MNISRDLMPGDQVPALEANAFMDRVRDLVDAARFIARFSEDDESRRELFDAIDALSAD